MNDRHRLLGTYGRFYGEEHFAVTFTTSTEGDDAKRITIRGWDQTKPLADGSFGAAYISSRGHDRNPACVLRPSHLIALESDSEQDLVLIEELGLPQTLTVRSSTPYKRHFYFRPPEGLEALPYVAFRFESGKLTADSGRCFLLPPSIHPSGAIYSFLPGLGPGETDIVELPEQIYRDLCDRARHETSEQRERIAVDPEAKILAGQRRDLIFRYACMLRRWGRPYQAILAECLQFNAERCEPPVAADLVEVQVHGAMKKTGDQELANPNVTRSHIESPPLSELLDQIELFIRRFVVVDETQATALVLWVLHTWAIDAARVTPYLWAFSAEPESGKTRLLEVLGELTREPLLTMNISDAALFRAIDAKQPTLFFDEVDAIFSPKARERGVREDLRALLNAGYRRGQLVYRMGGGNRTTLESFCVFSAKVLAGLGTLPPTLASRCIPIELKRRRLTEPLEDFYPEDVAADAGRLREQLEAWAAGAVDTLQAARPARVEGVRDRTMEVWRPLIAIAELDGEPWAARARRAVVSLTIADDDDPSLGLLLLENVRSVLEPEPEPPVVEQPEPVDLIPTVDLIYALARFEESPWGEWWLDPKTERPTRSAPRRLAQLLRPYGIRPKVVRIDDTTPRGYARTDFIDAWERFLGSRPSATSATCATSAWLSQANVADVADVAHTRDGGETLQEEFDF